MMFSSGFTKTALSLRSINRVLNRAHQSQKPVSPTYLQARSSVLVGLGRLNDKDRAAIRGGTGSYRQLSSAAKKLVRDAVGVAQTFKKGRI